MIKTICNKIIKKTKKIFINLLMSNNDYKKIFMIMKFHRLIINN